MTLQQFVKIAQNYLDIENECTDTTVTECAYNMCATAFETLSEDDQHTVRVLCDVRIADIVF